MNKLDLRMIRSLINGEIPGARKTMFFVFFAIFVWIAGMYYLSNASRMEQSYKFQQERLITLNELAVQYKQLMGERGTNEKTAAGDLVPVFSQIVEEAGMRDRLLQISPVSRGVSVQMDRLYAEDLVALLNGLNKYGIRVLSSELRALPFQDKRLF
ncbi:MAG: hypothetical protein FWG09_07960, partial [Synergistaceae bacterium]|nr:hypothetical protein [Synergistaceae bacterium]